MLSRFNMCGVTDAGKTTMNTQAETTPDVPLPWWPIALIKGFLLRPLFCGGICIAFIVGGWWCAEEAKYHASIATGFQMPPEAMTSDQKELYRLGMEADPLIMLETERGQQHLLISSHYLQASNFSTWMARGWLSLCLLGACWRR